MRIIHSAGFSDEEKVAFKGNIASNILSAIQVLLSNTVDLCMEDEEEARKIEAISDRPTPSGLIPYVQVIIMIHSFTSCNTLLVLKREGKSLENE